MRPIPSVLVVLVLLILLAGCTGYTAEDADEREPYAVTDPLDPSLEAPTEPIRSNETGSVIDAGELWQRHFSTLQNDRFLEVLTIEYRDEDGAVVTDITQQTMVEPEGGIYWRQVTVETSLEEGHPIEREYWHQDGRTLERVEYANGTVEVRENSAIFGVDYSDTVDFHEALEVVDEPAPGANETVGSTLVGTGDVDPYVDAEVLVHIEGNSLIERVDVAGTTTVHGERYGAEIRLEVVERGTDVDLSRPDWVDEISATEDEESHQG